MRLATWNVHKCQGLDRKVSVRRIADVICECKPDVIGLQEIFAEQAEELARILGMHLAPGFVRKLFGEPYGNATLSLTAPHQTELYDISVPGREPRGGVRADFGVEEAATVHFFNFHFGTGFLERRRQARLIADAGICRLDGEHGPRVVVGDFNEWTHGQVSRMLACEFRGADIRVHLKGRRTYPGVFPVLHLDHIYYDEALTLHGVALHRTPKALIASDHVPLYADFRLSTLGANVK